MRLDDLIAILGIVSIIASFVVVILCFLKIINIYWLFLAFVLGVGLIIFGKQGQKKMGKWNNIKIF